MSGGPGEPIVIKEAFVQKETDLVLDLVTPENSDDEAEKYFYDHDRPKRQARIFQGPLKRDGRFF